MTITRLLGLDFSDVALDAVARRLALRPASAAFGYVVTLNADHLVRLHRQPELRVLYEGAALQLLDSRVVGLLCRLLRLRAPAVVAGSDLTARIVSHHLDPGERITVVGLQPRYLPALVARCAIAEPFHYNPPMGFEHDAAALGAAVAFVLDHPARFVFLAVGSPRQEMLAAAIAATGQATGTGLCIGASLEFLAGSCRRAPGWMRAAGLEWLHRLAGDPRRLARRYLLDSPVVLPMLLRETFLPGSRARISVRNRMPAWPRWAVSLRRR